MRKTIIEEVMKSRNQSLITLAVFILIFSSCSAVSPSSEAKKQGEDSQNNSHVNQTEINTPNHSQSVNFKGVSFQNKIPLVSNIETLEKPASPLENEDDKPDYIKPRHLSFGLKGEYATRNEENGFSPEIIVYPIAEFRQAFAISEAHIRGFDEEINSLENIISKKTSKIEDFPYLLCFECTHDVESHLKYISFKNGEGVLYLTQFNLGPSIINNERLTYAFQGITADKQYYILGTFPVRSKILPDSIYVYKFKDYVLPQFFYDRKNDRENEKKYKKYLASVETLLNKQKASDFNPDLDKIEETISSLEVNWQD